MGCVGRWMGDATTPTEWDAMRSVEIAWMNTDDQRNSRRGVSCGAGDGVARDHLLLTVLGTNPRTARYSLAGRESEATLAPIALLDLLQPTERPNRVMALCTSHAKKESWPILEEALRNKYRLELVEVSAGDTQEDVNAYLTRVSGAIAEQVDLTVDVTHVAQHPRRSEGDTTCAIDRAERDVVAGDEAAFERI